jgi:hypothetical protein
MVGGISMIGAPVIRTNLLSLLSVLPLLLTLQLAVAAQTQLTGTISGRVLDADQAATPIEGAIVTVTNEETGLVRSVLSRTNGEYSIELLPSGLYALNGRKDGYENTSFGTANNFPVLIKQNKVEPPPIRLRKIVAVTQTPAARPGAAPPAPAPAAPVSGAQFARLTNTDNATRSVNFDAAVLLALPIPGTRTFDSLALLAPGVAPPPATIGKGVGPGLGPGVGTSGQFSANGLRSRANNFTVDGSDNNDDDIGVRRQGFTALLPQSIESIREFRLTTLLPEPQFGRNLGAQIDAVSRSGRTNIYGNLYGFLTDRRLNARDPFDLTGGPATFALQRADGRPIQLETLNPDFTTRVQNITLRNPVEDESSRTRASYGFIFGGPFINQSNFLVSYERQQINASREVNFAVPTVAQRGLFGSGDQGLRVTNAQGQPLAVFPTSTAGDLFYSLFPMANNPRGPYGANTFTQVLPANANGNVASLKLDQPNLKVFGKQSQLTGRYNFTDDVTTLPVTGEAIYSSLKARVRTQNLSFFLNSTLLETLENQIRFSYGRTRLTFADARSFCSGQRLPEHCLLRSSRFPGSPFLLNSPLLINATIGTIGAGGQLNPGNPIYSYQGGTSEDFLGPIGQVVVSGFSPIGVDVNNFPQDRVNNVFQIADTAILRVGDHRFTSGVDARRAQLNSRLERNFRPRAVFSGAADIISRFQTPTFVNPNQFYSGSDFVATGAVTGFFQTQGLIANATSNSYPDPTIGLRYWLGDFFFSDQIRVQPNLTLTIGLRYELNTVPGEINRRIERTFVDPLVFKFIDEERKLTGGVSGFDQYLAGRRSIYQRDSNNVAPHLAFAWNINGRATTVLRGGYGVYYDQILGAVISQSRSVFPTFVTYNLAGLSPTQGGTRLSPFNPNLLARPGTLNVYNQLASLGSDVVDTLISLRRFSNPIPGRPSTFPGGPGFVLAAYDLVTPYAQHWTLTLEQQFSRDYLISAAYVGTKGTHLLRFATPNYGPNVLPVVNGALLQGGVETVFTGFSAPPGPNFSRTFPFLGSFTSIESNTNSSYHSFQTQLDKRLSNGIQFTTAYTWSHAIDEVSDVFDLAGTRALPQNSSNRAAERADASYDVRHRFTSSLIWDLPFARKNVVIGGWQLAGILTLQTGQPFTIYSGYDVNLDGNLTDRLNSAAGIAEINEGAERYRVPGDIASQRSLVAAVGSDGAVARNTFRAPGIANIDLSVNKHFRFDEKRDLELRVEFFNLLNRAHFGTPVNQLGFPSAGRSVDTTIPARMIQVAGRFYF